MATCCRPTGTRRRASGRLRRHSSDASATPSTAPSTAHSSLFRWSRPRRCSVSRRARAIAPTRARDTRTRVNPRTPRRPLAAVQ
eukprot:2614655-Prymnesium_polylepis.1